MLVSTKDMLEKAHAEGYAIPSPDYVVTYNFLRTLTAE